MNWSPLNRITCKTCDSGLNENEEVNEQCNGCILDEELEENDKHCPTCRCNEEG